jgi:aryl-alcohol dehydrogenase-like predicted oxidoreductase
MRYIKLGRTGLDVSALCLGCMSFGQPQRGTHSWTLDEEASRPILRRAIEAGINFFDTANVYSDGSSEEILGRALKAFARRDEIVIATKVSGQTSPGPNGGGLSRKAVLSEIDKSLMRLGIDYVDIYQIHRIDPQTPIEETLEAFHDVVKAGEARYIGASSMHAWQFADMLHTSERHGWTRFVTMQNHLNLLYREEEREMLPLCGAKGIGVMPWSPLARGRLARPWGEVSARSRTDAYGSSLYDAAMEADRVVVDRVVAAAMERGAAPGQLALAWLLTRYPAATPIVGVSRLEQLNEALAAVDLTLTAEEVAAVEAPYVSHAVQGFA